MGNKSVQKRQNGGSDSEDPRILFLKVLFIIHERHSEREAETEAEGEAGSMKGAQCGTRSQFSRITPWAEGGAKPVSYTHLTLPTM